MTAEKQYVDDFSNEYRGKKWSIFAIIGIMVLVCITIAIRDIGMVFIYGSIFDKIAVDGAAKASVSFMSYVYMLLLYVVPLILPIVLRLTKGAYYDEPQTSLIPSFGSKALNVLVYVVLVLAGIVPLVLCMVGIFTGPYMFVALNIMLMLLSTVVIFYYFGTYILQRAKQGLIAKYILTNGMMVAVSAAAGFIAIAVVVILSLLGVNVTLMDHMTRFHELWETNQFITQALVMFVTIGLATIISGLIYNYSQNILYSVIPTFGLSFANVVLLQRAREAYNFIQTSEAGILGYEEKIAERLTKIEGIKQKIAALDPNSKSYIKTLERHNKDIDKANRDIANFETKIADLKADLPIEQICMILCYVLVGVMIVAISAVGAYALIRVIVHLVQARKAKKNA